jgi:hypothetical protein
MSRWSSQTNQNASKKQSDLQMQTFQLGGKNSKAKTIEGNSVPIF